MSVRKGRSGSITSQTFWYICLIGMRSPQLRFPHNAWKSVIIFEIRGYGAWDLHKNAGCMEGYHFHENVGVVARVPRTNMVNKYKYKCNHINNYKYLHRYKNEYGMYGRTPISMKLRGLMSQVPIQRWTHAITWWQGTDMGPYWFYFLSLCTLFLLQSVCKGEGGYKQHKLVGFPPFTTKPTNRCLTMWQLKMHLVEKVDRNFDTSE